MNEREVRADELEKAIRLFDTRMGLERKVMENRLEGLKMNRGERAKATRIANLGGEKEYKQEMSRNGSKGGRLGTTGGFYGNTERAKEAGRKGGKSGKRSRVDNN